MDNDEGTAQIGKQTRSKVKPTISMIRGASSKIRDSEESHPSGRSIEQKHLSRALMGEF